MATEAEVGKVLVYLSALFPRFTMAKGTPEAYYTILADLPADVLKAAAVSLACSSSFFPSAGELRRTANELTARAHNELTPEEAWVTVCNAIQRWGSYGEPLPAAEGGGYRMPTELDGLMLRAIQGVGGWKALCLSETPGVERAHFLRVYEGLQRADRGEALMLPAVRDVVNRLADKAGVPRCVAPKELGR